MHKRVVITGFGCITPVGESPDQAWRNLLDGISGVGPITTFDATGFPVRFAAEVSDWDVSKHISNVPCITTHARQTQFAVAAADMAMQHAGLTGNVRQPEMLGVSLGCGEIFPDFGKFGSAHSAGLSASTIEEDFNLGSFIRATQGSSDTNDDFRMEPAAAINLIAGHVGAEGLASNYTSACVSSTIAVGEASEAIRIGNADVMLAGGAHSMIHPFGVTGFHRLSALSTRNDNPQAASRPFDRLRDGFVVGEGGAILVLEELEHAQSRGAKIWAEVTGYGSAHDAFRITDPHPDAESAAIAIRAALKQANVNSEDIDYINAHGSGTVVNDRFETTALKRAFGESAYNIPASSTKSMTGHLTTACGALELMVCALAVHDGAIPPTINQEESDPDCDLDYVANQSRELSVKHALNNNSGFGGQNAAVVVSRFDD